MRILLFEQDHARLQDVGFDAVIIDLWPAGFTEDMARESFPMQRAEDDEAEEERKEDVEDEHDEEEEGEECEDDDAAANSVQTGESDHVMRSADDESSNNGDQNVPLSFHDDIAAARRGSRFLCRHFSKSNTIHLFEAQGETAQIVDCSTLKPESCQKVHLTSFNIYYVVTLRLQLLMDICLCDVHIFSWRYVAIVCCTQMIQSLTSCTCPVCHRSCSRILRTNRTMGYLRFPVSRVRRSCCLTADCC